ncbi:MAG: 30S ribosomal protein S6 [Hyphomicrobiaceae bacterium]|nr:30S ribosomal protein S6 [Hyphomicrobiaceae bacterium]
MPLYEHVFLARQDISNAQVDQLVKEYSEVIEQGGGKVARSEYWGLKGLAFKISKGRKAHYVMLNIDAPPAAVSEMERRMGIATDILRFLTVRVEAHEAEPSVMMRKSDRDERGERGDRGDRPGGRGGPRGDRPPRDGGFRGDRPPRGEGGGGGGYRGDRDGGGGGGFRGGDRGDRPPRREGEGGDRPPRPPRPAMPRTEG